MAKKKIEEVLTNPATLIINEVEKKVQKEKVQKTEFMNLSVEVYSRETIAELNKRSKQIKTELGKVEGAFSKIAFNLYWVRENDAHKVLGYKNIYDFAKKEFGIARGTCCNFISIVDRFAKRVDGQVVEEIDENYKHFKSSQLILMLGLDDDEIKTLDCEMSVRDMKKAIKGMESEETSQADNFTGEEELIDVESKVINRQVLITVDSLESYDKQEDKIYDMIKRALKDPKHKVEIAYIW